MRATVWNYRLANSLMISFVYFSGLAIQLEATSDDLFPNLFQHMIGKDRFRFFYELNWFDKNNQSLLASKLVDESYSFSLGSGRLMVNNGVTPKLPNEYSIFFWFSDVKLQEYFWLRPFICPSVRREASEAAVESGLLFTQGLTINEMLTFKKQSSKKSPQDGQFILQGLGALLANTAEQHLINLERLDNSSKLQNSSTSVDANEQQEEATNLTTRWLLDTKLGYWLEFDFQKWNSQEELSFEHIVGLRIQVFKSEKTDGIARPGAKFAQLTVLKAIYQFPDSLVRLPKGYSCHHSALKPPVPFKSTPINLRELNKYTLEVTVTTSANPTTITEESRRQLREPLSIPEPSTSMVAPASNSSVLILIVNRRENSLSVVSELNEKATKRQDQLSLWDLNTKRYYKLSGSCKGPVEFKSSLQLVGMGDEPESEGIECESDSEQLVIKLSENLGVRLTATGLKWLMFELQNTENLAELVDFSLISDDKLEVNYEAYARGLNLCLINIDTGKPLDEFKSIRLSTTYWYSLKEAQWAPKSSSLQFFDATQTQLIMQINLRLVHSAPYSPWISERHKIDLTACKRGPRESAKLLVEYPLSLSESDLLNQVSEPHELIRTDFFNYLRAKYRVALWRVPSISVSITDGLVRVEAQILDQAHLLHDSEALEVTGNVNSTQYMNWLGSATRSILVNSLHSCADYCQIYRCEVYVFCTYSISCYIFSKNALSDVSNSLSPATNLVLGCSAFRVLPSRDEAQMKQSWHATTWSLDEILENIQQSVNNPFEDENSTTLSSKSKDLLERLGEETSPPIIRKYASLRTTDGSRSEKLLKLTPTFAHYQYDNPIQNQAVGKVFNPFLSRKQEKLANEQADMNQESNIAFNFEVALAGHRLLESSDLNIVKYHDQLQHLDLDDTDGYLSVEDHSLDECLRLCVADASCASVSYCSSSSQCLVSRLNQTGLDHLKARISGEGSSRQNSNLYVSTEGGLLSRIEIQEDPGCSIMMRTYSDQFERLELKMLFTYYREPLDDVLTIVPARNPEECATMCVLERYKNFTLIDKSAQSIDGNKRNSACLSYDFCQPINPSTSNPSVASCILYNRHLVSKSEHLSMVQGDHGPEVARRSTNSSLEDKDILSVLKEDIGLNISSFCWHYVRNYMSDFHKINGRRLADEMRGLVLRNSDLPEIDSNDTSSKTVIPTSDGSDISLVRCARLCEEDPNCGAFEFCALSHRDIPGGLYLSCSLGSNETLAMVPIGGYHDTSQAKPPQRYVSDMVKLARHRFCSVYVYKALSTIAGRKKKNFHLFAEEILDATKEDSILNLMRLDLVLFCLFFLFGLIVRDLDLSQFSFRRMEEFPDQISPRSPRVSPDSKSQRMKIWPSERTEATTEIYRDEFKLESLRDLKNKEYREN